MEVDHNGWKLAKTVEGLEVCALGDDHEEWLDKPDQMTGWERMTTEVRIADTCRITFVACHSVHPRRKAWSRKTCVFDSDQGNHCATKL